MPGYNFEMERLYFQLGHYSNTDPAVQQALRLLLQTTMPAFVPFKDVTEARQLIESFYFNTQLVQEQIDYNAYNLLDQQRANAIQQAVISDLEALTQKEGYRSLADNLRRMRETYVNQLGFYEILEFKSEEERAQRVAMLKQIEQYV